MKAIDQDGCRLRCQCQHRATHRQQTRLQNVDFIDFLDAGAGHSPGDGMQLDFLKQQIAPFCREFFGVPQTLDSRRIVENHSGGKYRSGQRPTPCFIDAADYRVHRLPSDK